ncbi:MAG: peptidylprolyl isomerase [Candidatus Vogelbacteria bacterium]
MATIETTDGTITVELFKNDAPKTVENFITLAGQGFYDGTLFHRVIKNFMIQGGDPNTKTDPKDWTKHGAGGPGYAFADEFNARQVVRGALAMANAGPNTNGSQFFIVTAESAPWLDGKHIVFGQVVSGYDVVQKIENVATDPARGDHPLTDVVVTKVTVQ